jgi:hypothetical protein
MPRLVFYSVITLPGPVWPKARCQQRALLDCPEHYGLRCIYSISKFDDVIKMNAEGKLEIPQPLAELLNAVSVSTARGAMFSAFKGTFLHNALLPMVEPHQFKGY